MQRHGVCKHKRFPFFTLTIPTLVQGQTLTEPLSERELEVLKHPNGPMSTAQAAEQLTVSASTVRTHVKNIYSKLGVHGRYAAVRQARLLRLLV